MVKVLRNYAAKFGPEELESAHPTAEKSCELVVRPEMTIEEFYAVFQGSFSSH